MKAGDTFQLVGVADQHLWIVISDPMAFAQIVLFVNVTSFDQFVDQTVILDAGDHPFIQHRSCVNYPRARVATDAQLEALKAGGRLQLREPVTAAVLTRIRLGACESRYIKMDHLQILKDQGLVEI